jgi:hypothetical protein
MDGNPHIFQSKDITEKQLSWSFAWTQEAAIQKVIEILGDNPWRFVGGCVRDSLINKLTYDIDINTPLLPHEIIHLFQNFTINSIGRDHGTIMVFLPPFKIEITTLRKDLITDGRKAVVGFTDSWQEDSNRRDFTINGLMVDYHQQLLYDYHGGIEDLIQGQVKFIGRCQDRVQEDYLRILRFVRFSIRFQGEAHDLTILKPLIPGLKKVSKERIINEITLIVQDNNWMKGIQYLKYLSIDGLLDGDFNDDFSWIQGELSLVQRWAALLLIRPNPFHQWSMEGAIKKILMASNHDIHQIKSQDLFAMFTNNLWDFSAMAIKNLIIYGPSVNGALDRLNNFLKDNATKNSYEQQKIVVLSQYEGAKIREHLMENLYNLWTNYTH